MPEHSVLEVTTDTIMAMTAEFFGFTIAQLSGTSKSRPITHARQIAMYLCRELTELSLPKVGGAVWPRPHHRNAFRTQDSQRTRRETRHL